MKKNQFKDQVNDDDQVMNDEAFDKIVSQKHLGEIDGPSIPPP